MLAVTAHSGFGALGRTAPVAITLRAHATSTSNLTDYAGEFDGVAIGPATADRKVVVAVHSIQHIALTCLIGATSGTRVATAQAVTSGACVAFFQFNAFGSGTTADIDILLPSLDQRLAIGVWSVTGAADTIASTDNDHSSNNPTISNFVIPVNGGAVAGSCEDGSGTATNTWTNITEDYDGNMESLDPYSGASSVTAGTVTIDVNSTLAGTNFVMVAVAFNPA